MEQRKSNKIKIVSIIICLLVVITLIPTGIITLPTQAATVTIDVNAQNSFTIPASSTDNYIITGTTTVGTATGNSQHHADASVIIESGYSGTITLQNLSITQYWDRSCIWVKGNNNNDSPSSKVTFLLEGTNSLSSGAYYNGPANGTSEYSYYPALFVEAGAQIIIDDSGLGTGSLIANTVEAPSLVAGGRGGAAAIGGGGKGSTATPADSSRGGNIDIRGGTITATSGFHAAAIGGGIAAYNGYVVVSGGNVTATGGGHGAGIGGGCVNTGAGGLPSGATSGTGIVAVLPPGQVTASGGAGGTQYLVGNVGSAVYIGDPSSPLVTVKTDENTQNADIFMNLSNIPDIVNVIGKMGIPTSEINPEKILFGNTGTSGVAQLHMQTGTAQSVNFYTEATTTLTTPTGLYFLADERAITAPTNITLKSPVLSFSITTNPATIADLTYGYTSSPEITVTVKNTGNCDIENLTFTPDTTFSAGFDVTSPLSKTKLAVNETATIKVKLKNGLNVGSYTASVTVKGDGVSGSGSAKKTVPITATQPLANQKVVKATGGGGTVSASPQPDNDYHNYTDVTLTTAAGANNSISSWKYAITNSATAPVSGSSDWLTGTTNPAFPSTPADGTFYIHWTMENSNYVDTFDTISNSGVITYKLDRINPTVLSITSDSAAVGASNFNVEIQFSEDVSFQPFDTSKLDLTNATLVGTPILKPGTTDTYIFTLQPNSGLTSSDKIGVAVKEGAVKDKATNLNVASNASNKLELNFTDNAPVISNYSFTAGQIYKTNQTSVTLDIMSKGTTNKTLSLNGTPVSLSDDVSSLFEIDGLAASTSYTVVVTNIDITTGTYTVTITPTGGFPSGEYTVKTKASSLSTLKNSEGNTLIASTRSFKVNIPVLTPGAGNFTVSPTTHADYTGGTVTITIKGEYFNQATIGIEMTKPDGTTSTLTPTVTGGDTSTSTAVATVNIGPNTQAVDEVYTFKPILDGTVSATSGTSTIPEATAGIATDGSGFTVSPNQFNYTGGNSTITVKGTNLHNFTNLRIERLIDGVADTTGYPINSSTTQTGVATLTHSVSHGANYTGTAVVYTYNLISDVAGVPTVIATQTVTVDPPTRSVDSVSFQLTSGTLSSPGVITTDGGTVDITVTGNQLQSYSTLELKEVSGLLSSTTWNIAPTSTASIVNSVNQLGIVLPANLQINDVIYTFEVYADGNATGVKVDVTVQGRTSRVDSLTIVPSKFSSAGGISTINVTGMYMDLYAPLVVKDITRGVDIPLVVSTDPTKSSASGGTVTFPVFTGGARNDIYEFEVYADNQPTGVTAVVEVGDSIPNVSGVIATPNYYATVEAASKANGLSIITVQGNYLFNYNEIKIYDPIYDKYYVVANPGDTEASVSINVPTATGIYDYNVFIDGEDTGLVAQVGVGYQPGGSVTMPPKDDGTVEEYNTDKQWASRGGGSKGRGFTGRKFVGFDILAYQCEQAAKENPKNPIVIVSDLYYITRDQIDLAAVKGHEGARASEQLGKGDITMIFDTLNLEDNTMLDGRLTIDISQPVADLYPGVFTAPDEVDESLAIFKNKVTTPEHTLLISLGQNDSYGSEVKVSAYVDLEEFNTDTLYLYRLDRKTGSYELMENTKYYVDSTGYLHFYTKIGGDIIVTDTPLAQSSGSIA